MKTSRTSFASRIALLLLGMLFTFSAAARAADSIGYFDAIKNEAKIEKGQSYYMRHCLMFEKDAWDATNYWRGVLLPINTQVKLESIGGSYMVISWEGYRVKINNNQYTKIGMPDLAKRMLSRTPVPIEKFGKDMAGKIASGSLVLGMTREQIIMARGYPPAHKTPTIHADNGNWIYWTSRFATEVLNIKNGLLEKARNATN